MHFRGKLGAACENDNSHNLHMQNVDDLGAKNHGQHLYLVMSYLFGFSADKFVAKIIQFCLGIVIGERVKC